MKRIILLAISAILILSLCSCGNQNTESLNFSQKVTIVKLPSPPKCKTTDDISTVNEIISILGEIEKTPKTCGNTNGWLIMIKLNIDGQNLNYTIAGDTFTDSDGKQYGIKNFDEIEKKITEIYNKIDAPEVDYP